MSISMASDSEWTDDSSEVEDIPPSLQPRGYQIEMFQESMKQNTIVTMETGSGKTMIARLRIEAELERSPGKRIWFTTPNVGLVHQQLRFLEAQLPVYSFISITGLDNTDFWTSQDVWDAALLGKHGVISTPQILLDGLTHAFISLRDYSLLVIDEAHHGQKNHAVNTTMQRFYHPLKTQDPAAMPHILALTASPMNNDDLTRIQQLEQNLNAVCRTPTANLEEYRRHVHLPKFVRIDYENTAGKVSRLLLKLEKVIQDYNLAEDPEFKKYQGDESLEGSQKFEKVVKSCSTPLLKQLRKFSRQAQSLQDSLGTWATDHYISACITKAVDHDSGVDGWLFTLDDEEKFHLRQTLDPFLQTNLSTPSNFSMGEVSDKVIKFAEYLDHDMSQNSSCIIFVERRSTAWALKELLDRVPSLARYKIFTLVGATNVRRNELSDLADRRLQDENFADFKARKRDICVATSVAEEGLDVQSCDLVICFDHPFNMKSFIQRRGRARHPESRFAILQSRADISAKYDKWADLEEIMKQDYTSRRRHLEELEANEAIIEHCDRSFRVPSTGAVLTIDNARQHLHHFCATLPRRTGTPSRTSPIYILTGIHNINLTCELILPTSLPPDLQKVYGPSTWRTEAMAKKDAAFEAYKRLHAAGLVDDHLLPPVVEKSTNSAVNDGSESLLEIPLAMDPWQKTRADLLAGGHLFTHRMLISGADTPLPALQLLLPVQSLHSITCELQVSTTTHMAVRIDAFHPDPALVNPYLAMQITKFLFKTTLARRLPGIDAETYSLPYFLIPDAPCKDLQAWLDAARDSVPLHQPRLDPGRVYVLQNAFETMPYFSSADGRIDEAASDFHAMVRATKLSRRIDFSHLSSAAEPQPKGLKVSDCSVLGLHPGFVRVISYIPTIMHHVELALRAQDACTSVLQSIQFQGTKHVTTALTAPGVTYYDFQRLEYLGDALLKFYSTVNVFCSNPLLPESQLTALENEIVKNERLLKSTLDLGLDRYLSTRGFSARDWSLKEKQEDVKIRKVSSKTLADVVESLVGAAYTDGDGENEQKALRALSLFIPEVNWKSPAQDIASLLVPDIPALQSSERLSQVESIIDYKFQNRSLLMEALTHSTAQVGHGTIRSYERLEFLGDAVIDIIVKKRLFNSRHSYTEGEMHSRHIALVNKDIFAYLTTKNTITVQENIVTTDPVHKKAMVEQKVKNKSLHDFMARGTISNEEISEQTHFLETYTTLSETIAHALSVGVAYPWSDIYALNSPKWHSDIFESVVGAVFIDSRGCLTTCTRVLRTLGLMKFVDRAVEERDWDVQQPMRRVREMDARIKVDVKRFGSDRGGTKYKRWACRIRVVARGGEEGTEGAGRVVVGALVKACSCPMEAESRAAEVLLEKIKAGRLKLGGKMKGKVNGKGGVRGGIDQEIGTTTRTQESKGEGETNEGLERHVNETAERKAGGGVEAKKRKRQNDESKDDHHDDDHDDDADEDDDHGNDDHGNDDHGNDDHDNDEDKSDNDDHDEADYNDQDKTASD